MLRGRRCRHRALQTDDLRTRFIRFVVALAFVLTTLAAASPAPSPLPAHGESSAPPASPDGTYIYELSRKGTVQGQTTIGVLPRPRTKTIETDEAGAIGAARAHIVASFRTWDFGVDSEIATYAAPFPRDSLGFGGKPCAIGAKLRACRLRTTACVAQRASPHPGRSFSMPRS